jgi:hypothetical protein
VAAAQPSARRARGRRLGRRASPKRGGGGGRAGPPSRLGRTRGGGGEGQAAPRGKPAGPRALMGHKERGKKFPFSIFLFSSKLHSKILFTNHSTTNKKIMVRHDATTKENISRVCLHKISS